ncbi:hypothetical protein Peur_053003 [Populus x canadensis]
MAKRNKGSSSKLQSEAPIKLARRDKGSISVTLDSEVLDCPICFKPFTIPVFQVFLLFLHYCL